MALTIEEIVAAECTYLQAMLDFAAQEDLPLEAIFEELDEEAEA